MRATHVALHPVASCCSLQVPTLAPARAPPQEEEGEEAASAEGEGAEGEELPSLLRLGERAHAGEWKGHGARACACRQGGLCEPSESAKSKAVMSSSASEKSPSVPNTMASMSSGQSSQPGAHACEPMWLSAQAPIIGM